MSAADGAATASATGLAHRDRRAPRPPRASRSRVGSIKATITEGGSPLANAKVTVTGPNAFSVTQTASAGGIVTFSGVGAGSGYTVTAADGPASAQKTSVSVSGSSTTNVAIDIPAGSLKVTVTAGGSAISGVTVTVTGPSSYSATGTTNASGICTFASIPGGSNFTVAGTIGGSSASQTGVSVASGAETDVSLALPTGSIRTAVLIGGQPLAGQTVTVTGPGSFSASGKTDSTGLYVLTNVPVGTGYTVSTVYGSTVQQTGQSVAKNTRTDVLLSIPAGSLKVTVQNQSGTAIQGADVALTSTNGVTAPDGTTLSDGTYVFSVPAASGYKLIASFGAGSVTSASQTVTNGATTSVTLTLSTGSIKVTVQNSAGTTYSGAGLTLTGPNSFSATGTTTSAGVFTFSGIPTGSSAYSVAATYAGASANATGISVSSGATTSTTVTIPTGSIKVTVTAGGSNVGGSAVTVTYPGGFTASGTTASGSGSVTLTNIPSGTGYTVSATDAAATGTATGVNVTSGNTTSSAVAIPVGSLAVTATVAGSPVGSAAVTVSYPGGFSATGTTANSGPSLGTVTLTNIPAGSGYSISATSNGATGTTTGVAVTSGSTTAATVVIPTGSIAVTVKNQSGTLLNGASLTLTGPGSYSATGSTGSGSTYTFPNVPINATGYIVTATLGAGSGSTPRRGRLGAHAGQDRHGHDQYRHGCDHGRRSLDCLLEAGQRGRHSLGRAGLFRDRHHLERDGLGQGNRDLQQRPEREPVHGDRFERRHHLERHLLAEQHHHPLAPSQVLMHARGLQTTVRREHGFTLIEMLVVMFIVGIVFAAFGLVISTTVRHAALITNEGVAQHQVRTALDQLTEDLREATVSSSTDTSPFVTTAGVMSGTSLTFYAPDQTYSTGDQTDYHLREISYQLSGGEPAASVQRQLRYGRPPVDDPDARNAGDARERRPQLGGLHLLRRQPAAGRDDRPCGGQERGRHGHPLRTRHGPPVQLLGHGNHARDTADMSRLLRRLRDESGQTMMLVVFAIALVSTLAVGLVDLVTSEAQSSGQAASSDSAYQAAESGIDSYASKLLDDHLYFLHYVADGRVDPSRRKHHRRAG